MRSRLIAAVVLAPLAGPAAVWALSLVAFTARCLRAGCPGEPSSIVSVAVLLFAFILFGYPIALAGATLIALPAFLLAGAEAPLRSARTVGVVIVGGVGGAAIAPVYLRWLEPRGSISLVPGSGFVAGVAVAVAFVLVARQGRLSR